MKKQYQVTIMCRNGKYKPVSCIISMEQMEDVDYTADKEKKRLIKNLGVTKICQQRYWTINDLKKYDYTRIIIRLYDKEKIDAENKVRYDAIKEEKYKSGEWKRPKSKALCN